MMELSLVGPDQVVIVRVWRTGPMDRQSAKHIR